MQKYAATLNSTVKPTPRQQLMLEAPAAVCAAQAAAAPVKQKAIGGKRKNPKPGQGALGGRKIKADAVRETEARCRRAGREKVRSWIRAAGVDHAIKGMSFASLPCALLYRLVLQRDITGDRPRSSKARTTFTGRNTAAASRQHARNHYQLCSIQECVIMRE